MTVTVLTSSSQHTRTIASPRPLLAVMAWDLRRFCASHLFWLQALFFFFLVFFVTWSTQLPGHPFAAVNSHGAINGVIAGNSAWGLLTSSLPTGPLLLLALLLPFVTADGVARDLHRRTHELLLTTALPSWAYVWGRYLTGLLLSLGLALLLLVAILGMGVLLHLTVPAYPLPPAGAVLLLWVGMVVPATMLISSVSFALGTVLPRQATLVKIVILLAWIIGVVILPSGLVGDMSSRYGVSAWYRAWDPTSATTAFGMSQQYRPDLMNQIATATSTVQVQNALLRIENRLPDVSTLFAPHLIEALLSLLVVVPMALAFRRFRNTFNA